MTDEIPFFNSDGVHAGQWEVAYSNPALGLYDVRDPNTYPAILVLRGGQAVAVVGYPDDNCSGSDADVCASEEFAYRIGGPGAILEPVRCKLQGFTAIRDDDLPW